ncbi:MAG: ATP-binding protein [Candidatus Methanoperedens sp.]|nr:ATP-binding protein [Candidatus Methanoperedens sp.]
MTGKKQILVVEDEAITAMDIQRRLKNLGYNVPVVVSSGEKAIEKVKENNPDLVLMDINLNREMDGIEAASQIHSFSDIPVIFMTAYSDEKTIERAKITEPYAYMLKPIKERELQINIDIAFFKHKIQKMSLENEGLIRASKTKSEFMMAMSHELRTPLNSIIGFSDLLKKKEFGELNEVQKKYIDNIHVSGNNLLMIINDILDLSKVEADKIDLSFEKMSIADVINISIAIVKDFAKQKKIQVITEIDPELDFIEADRDRIRQVLFNILNNAIKFSKPMGIVTLTARKEGDMAQISVSDIGIGIKEEDIGRLFKEFEQLDKGASRQYGGTGLGLVISKKLIELHGGKIWVKSRYGEGTIFTFTLPIITKDT